MRAAAASENCYFEEFVKKHYEKLMSRLGVGEEDVHAYGGGCGSDAAGYLEHYGYARRSVVGSGDGPAAHGGVGFHVGPGAGVVVGGEQYASRCAGAERCKDVAGGQFLAVETAHGAALHPHGVGSGCAQFSGHPFGTACGGFAAGRARPHGHLLGDEGVGRIGAESVGRPRLRGGRGGCGPLRASGRA